MKLNNNTEKKVSNHVIEIRQSSDFSYFDKRGAILNQLVKELGLVKYKIGNSNISVTNDANNITVFISDEKFAIEMETMASSDIFKEKALSFLNIVWSYYDSSNKIFRIGYRVREYSSSKDKFNKLLESYKINFVKVNENVDGLFSSPSSDIAIPLTFRDGNNEVVLQTGPMSKEQGKANFSNNVNWNSMTEQGIYKDFDYSTVPNKVLELSEILEMIDSFITKVSEKSLEVEKMILGKK